MASRPGDEDWQSVAEQTSKEMDPAKLTILNFQALPRVRWAERKVSVASFSRRLRRKTPLPA